MFTYHWFLRQRNHEGKQARRWGGSDSQEQRRETSLGDKAAPAAKSGPEGKLWRETSLGDKAAPARTEIMKGNKLGDKVAAAAKSSPEWRSWRETSLGDKAAAASWPFGDFGDQQPSHWEVRTPIASSYPGKNEIQLLKEAYKRKPIFRKLICFWAGRLVLLQQGRHPRRWHFGCDLRGFPALELICQATFKKLVNFDRPKTPCYKKKKKSFCMLFLYLFCLYQKLDRFVHMKSISVLRRSHRMGRWASITKHVTCSFSWILAFVHLCPKECKTSENRPCCANHWICVRVLEICRPPSIIKIGKKINDQQTLQECVYIILQFYMIVDMIVSSCYQRTPPKASGDQCWHRSSAKQRIAPAVQKTALFLVLVTARQKCCNLDSLQRTLVKQKCAPHIH